MLSHNESQALISLAESAKQINDALQLIAATLREQTKIGGALNIQDLRRAL